MASAALSSKRKAAKRFDSPQQEVYLNLWRTYDRLRAMEDELFARFDISAQQYNALRLLRAAHPRKVPTLAVGAKLISRAPDITRLLDKLHDRGLVDRERPADNRRVVNVGITTVGVALLDQMAGNVRDCHAKQVGHLSAAETKSLIELLRKARGPHEAEGDWK